MTKYSFILMGSDEGAFLEKLQECGVVDITRSLKPVDARSAELLAESEDLRKVISSLEGASFEGVDAEKFVPDNPKEEAREAFQRLESQTGELAGDLKLAGELQPWGDFSPERIKELEQNGLTVHFYKVPIKKFDPAWEGQYPISEISRDDRNIWFVTVSDASDYSFPLPEMPAPEYPSSRYEAEAAVKEKEILKTKARILGLKEYLPSMKEKLQADLSELDLYFASKAASEAAEGHIVTFTGFVPDEDTEKAEKAFEESGAFYLKEAAAVEDNPPISFRNNSFVRMFEVLTDMYGRPAYNGFDPTPFISVFFLLFFAFCMGDCGYGLILIIVGLLLKKVDSFKSLSPLVVTLGAGTAVIGFLFHTFFSMDISQWKIFEGIQWLFLPGKIGGYDGTMVLSIIVGIVHLCLAMVVKTWEETKNKGFTNSLGTWGWTLLIVGGVIVGGLSLVGVLDSDLTKWIIIVLGIVSAVGIFLFNDMSKGRLANVGLGLWNTYNTVTGLVGDVLSYLRLYALGLAGSMLGLAFNNIGGMVLGDGSNILSWIPFILIVIIGHTLNIAMAALGAFVHPLRLNFLEFFKNSGYEGVGRNYHPLKK